MTAFKRVIYHTVGIFNLDNIGQPTDDRFDFIFWGRVYTFKHIDNFCNNFRFCVCAGRIKKADTGNNPELEYQLKIYRNKLSSLGIPSEEYEM